MEKKKYAVKLRKANLIGHSPPCVKSPIYILCHMYIYIYIYFFLKDKVVELVGGGFVINGAYLV